MYMTRQCHTNDEWKDLATRLLASDDVGLYSINDRSLKHTYIPDWTEAATAIAAEQQHKFENENGDDEDNIAWNEVTTSAMVKGANSVVSHVGVPRILTNGSKIGARVYSIKVSLIKPKGGEYKVHNGGIGRIKQEGKIKNIQRKPGQAITVH